jgi:hypothetical protein
MMDKIEKFKERMFSLARYGSMSLGTAESIVDFIAELEAELARHRWVSVDELPEPDFDKDWLIEIDEGVYEVAAYTGVEGIEWFSVHGSFEPIRYKEIVP